MHPDRVMKGESGFFATVDDLLVARARRGDIGALEDLYRLFSTPVFTLARRIVRSREEAEETLQETFLEMVRSMRSFRGEGAFGAWLRRITISKALTALRRSRRDGAEKTIPGDVLAASYEAEHSAGIDSGWRRVDLERALARLPDTTRVVVWLHDVEGLTHVEIAELFGRSVSFSKSQLSRAHERLRRGLGRSGGIGDASEPGRVIGIAGR
jgi:RNA polymerase sigma-70 factor (ECF subfamily)